ncbi:MAG: NAD(P)/FAD-dependent oxidoreductase [Acholeplasmatales bacterium]|jgi:thioredoxin reductase (NADPH)|nr:NAD(P)/FAD-dependent oxidoreductase [Acholeplasmatales bacterium]
MEEVIIIGAGPSGVSAAVNLYRNNINPLVIYKDASNLDIASSIENYYGFKSISGIDLFNQGISQLDFHKIKHLEEILFEIKEIKDGFQVITNKNTYETRSIILANGIKRNKSDIKNLNLYEGRGISFCVRCDGFFYKNSKVSIIGNNSYLLHELSILREYTSDITVFTDGVDIDLNIPEKVIKDKIISFEGHTYFETIKTNSGVYDFDGCFIALGFPSNTTLNKTLGIELDNNFIKVNEKYETNMKGLFAVGDAIGGLLQVQKASYDGYRVVEYVKSYLKELKNITNG